MSPQESSRLPIHPLASSEQPKISMRRAFLTGLAALLPVTVTVVLLVWIIRLVGDPIAGPINSLIIWIMERAGVENAEWVFRNMEDPKTGVVYGWVDFSFAGYILAVAIIFAAGFALLTFLGRQLYRQLDRILARLPIMRMVYPHVKQLTDLIFSQNKMAAFRSVVMVEYPRKGIWSLGFITGTSLMVVEGKTTEELVTVFVPSTPTPFTGFAIAVPRRELIDLTMTVDAAIRFVVSGGVLVPPDTSEGGGKAESDASEADHRQ
jgi:uncharacterized membrane protein